MRSEVTRGEIEPQANVGPSGEILVKNQSTNPENPAQDHVLEANSKSIKDGECLKSKAYEDQVADYRNSQRRRFNTSKKACFKRRILHASNSIVSIMFMLSATSETIRFDVSNCGRPKL